MPLCQTCNVTQITLSGFMLKLEAVTLVKEVAPEWLIYQWEVYVLVIIMFTLLTYLTVVNTVPLQPLPLPLRLLLGTWMLQVSGWHGSGLVQAQLPTALTPPMWPTVLREVVSPSCTSAIQQLRKPPSLTFSATQTTLSLWWPLLESTGGRV